MHTHTHTHTHTHHQSIDINPSYPTRGHSGLTLPPPHCPHQQTLKPKWVLNELVKGCQPPPNTASLGRFILVHSVKGSNTPYAGGEGTILGRQAPPTTGIDNVVCGRRVKQKAYFSWDKVPRPSYRKKKKKKKKGRGPRLLQYLSTTAPIMYLPCISSTERSEPCKGGGEVYVRGCEWVGVWMCAYIYTYVCV